MMKHGSDESTEPQVTSRTARLVPADPILRICECLEAAGRNASHGDDTARGMAVAAATIRQVIERELPTPCLNCSQPLATHGGDPNGCPVFEPSELTAEEYAIERRVLYRQAREMNRLRAAVVSAVGVLRRGGDGLDHVTACEVWDGSQSCADRESAPCDGCIAAAQVADAVRLLEMGGPFGDLAATEPKP